MSTQGAVSLLKETYSSWSDHNAPRLGASVAFYSILSFAPLLVLITSLIALFFGHESANGVLINEARTVIGEHGAKAVDSLLKSAQKPASGAFASIIAFVTLLFGASGVFTELQAALNIMWDAPKRNTSGFLALIKEKLFSFGMVLTVGFLLLVSLLLSSALAFVGQAFGHIASLPASLLQAINFVVSFVVVSALFALMFKYVPDVHVDWRDTIIGAIGTALLFTIGKFLLGIYLGKASIASTYGAAGSLVAVVVWIYYSAQIFFFGAEFTRVYARAGSPRTAPAASTTPDAPPATELAPVSQQAPKTLAAAAGSSQSFPKPIAISHVPVAPAPDLAISPRAVPAPTKPKLLTALAVGFVAGRVASAVRNHQRRK